MAEQQQELLTIDLIRKIAPRYKGKPENFRRDRVGKPRAKREMAQQKRIPKIGPKTDQAVKGESLIKSRNLQLKGTMD
jgi:ribosomal protein L32E